MSDLPSNFTVVSDVEFLAFSALSSFEQKGVVLTRMSGDELHVVLSQSEFDHWQCLEAEIDTVQVFDDLLERPVSEIKPVTVTPAIPEIDRVAADSPGGVLGDVKRTDHN